MSDSRLRGSRRLAGRGSDGTARLLRRRPPRGGIAAPSPGVCRGRRGLRRSARYLTGCKRHHVPRRARRLSAVAEISSAGGTTMRGLVRHRGCMFASHNRRSWLRRLLLVGVAGALVVGAAHAAAGAWLYSGARTDTVGDLAFEQPLHIPPVLDPEIDAEGRKVF